MTGNLVHGGKGGTGRSGVVAPGKGGNGGFASGAGISGGNPLTLTRVAISDNHAIGGDGGVGGTASTTGTGGTGGQAGSSLGAGVSLGIGSSFVARDTLISGNQATPGTGGAGGGGGTTAGPGGVGGQGEPADGGGLFTNGIVKLTNVTLSGNSADGSTGGHGGAAHAVATAVAGGAGGSGAGGGGGNVALLNGIGNSGSAQFRSVTLASGDTTAAAGGAGGAGVNGGASGAPGGPGIDEGGNLFVYSSVLSMGDSIVALGTGDNGTESCSIRGGSVYTSLGHNLDDRHQCMAVAASGDLVDTPAALGPLQANGGATRTRALLPGSGAIGAGGSSCVDTAGAALTADQRGLPRGTPCDIGAFDGQAAVARTPTVAGTGVSGTAVTCTVPAPGGDAPQTIAVQWLRDGATIASGGALTVGSADVGHLLSCRATATNAFGSSTATSAGVRALAAPPPTAKAPTLRSLKLSPKKARNGHKEKLSFTLTGAAARVKFSLHRVTRGAKSGKRCVARTGKHRHGKPCTRLSRASGAPKAVSTKLGTTKVTWKPHGLKPGGYRLTASPVSGKAVTVAFTVRRQ